MRHSRTTTCVILWTAFAISSSAACIPILEATKHIGDTACVAAKVLSVSDGSRGTTYLNFCEDYSTCPFSVVVFGDDLRHVGDVRQLAGKQIEIHGDVREYDGKPEIILREARQLHGEFAKLPPLPKHYDVEKRPRFSAGTYSHPGSSSKSKQKRPTSSYRTYDPGVTDDE